MLENSPLVAKGAIVKRGEELVHAVLALGFGLLQTADTANAVDESMRTAGVSQNDRHDDLIALRGIGNTDREGAVVGAHEGSIFEVQGDVQLGASRADLLVGRNDGLAAADSSANITAKTFVLFTFLSPFLFAYLLY